MGQGGRLNCKLSRLTSLPLKPSLRLLRLSHLCGASPHASPNNKMAEVKPDWAIIQLEEKMPHLDEGVPHLDEKVAHLNEAVAHLLEEMAHLDKAMAHLDEEVAYIKERLANWAAHMNINFLELSSRIDEIEGVFYPFLETKICVTAGEVLKRAAGGMARKQFNHGGGRHFYGLSYNKLKLICMAYMGQDLAPDLMSLDLLKKDFQQIIQARNSGLRGVHSHIVEELTSVKKLTEAVDHCLLAFERFPTLKTEYPKQWTVVKQFEAFKSLLPNEFA